MTLYLNLNDGNVDSVLFGAVLVDSSIIVIIIAVVGELEKLFLIIIIIHIKFIVIIIIPFHCFYNFSNFFFLSTIKQAEFRFSIQQDKHTVFVVFF